MCTNRKKHSELQAHRAKTRSVTPSIFLLQFLNVLYIADICVKFEQNLDGTSFSSELVLWTIEENNTFSVHQTLYLLLFISWRLSWLYPSLDWVLDGSFPAVNDTEYHTYNKLPTFRWWPQTAAHSSWVQLTVNPCLKWYYILKLSLTE